MRKRDKRREPDGSAPRKAVVGFEAEFNLYLAGRKRRPETVFRNPQEIVRERMIPRTGRSFHMPSGGAVYFDTGVIEVATPIIELEQGCCNRAARSLWEQIAFLRQELNAWEARRGTEVRLEGFSQHFNVSVPLENSLTGAGLRQAALLLAYILPAPVMLLAANRLSTGIGVRPRRNRVEITVDFTPDPDLMTAAAALAIGIVLAVLAWPSHSLAELRRRNIPVIAGFRPRRHTSRKGWLARADCFPRNPFAADPGARHWLISDGRTLSLRDIAREIATPFRKSIRALVDAAGCEHIFAVFDGRARSLLDFPERPPRYSDVGRTLDWNRRAARRQPRSGYESVIHHILEHRRIRYEGRTYIPERMQGWYEIAFREVRTGRRRVFNLDELVASVTRSPRSNCPTSGKTKTTQSQGCPRGSGEIPGTSSQG
ncbi:MAG TPA: hypothetical protein VHY22_17690 [Chthoniobacteraceae bacterium]|jgi:hypothetical protein|nr:hypothetical protein [Chthoniobacteraceae bacterium]